MHRTVLIRIVNEIWCFIWYDLIIKSKTQKVQHTVNKTFQQTYMSIPKTIQQIPRYIILDAPFLLII